MIQKLSTQIPKAFYQHENTERAIVAYNLRVLKHFAPWSILGLEVLKHFGPKKSEKKNCHNLQRL